MSLVSLVLRACLGIMFLAHGLQKAFGFFNGPGIKGFSQMLSGLGFVPATLWAYIAAYTELIGGLCLVLGVLVRTFSSLLLILIVVAALTAHLSKGFFFTTGGFEYNFIIASVCVVLIILGGGKFSISKKY